MALRLAGLDALVIRGKAERLSCLTVASRLLKLTDVHFMTGQGVYWTGKVLRRMHGQSGFRSIWRIGPAGENRLAVAAINVDSYRHFGRLGGGGVMGAKGLKGVVILGDSHLPLPLGGAYRKLFADIHRQVTATRMMSKYYNLGTAANISALNEMRALPWRNLQDTTDPAAGEISGESFAREALLRNAACAGCPVGCIHIGYVREMFTEENRYMYVQVSYDYELIFALGSMIGVSDPFEVLKILDEVERQGLDAISAGVALAWATEALKRGVVSQAETIVPLRFGDAQVYRHALKFLAEVANEFYATLGQGTLKAAARYGGEDFACVLGQEMAGYATGEVAYASQALGLRHSHLDTGGYAFDQKMGPRPPVDEVLDFLIKDERDRVMLTSMVACLFARSVYKEELCQEALSVLGLEGLAEGLPRAAERAADRRWRVRLATGFDPGTVRVPRRFFEIDNWKGKPDVAYFEQIKKDYAAYITAKGGPESNSSSTRAASSN